jgi:hypothetical protein
MAEALPDAAPEIQGLARKMEVIVYAEAAPPDEEIAATEGSWAAVVAKATRRRSWRGRVLRYLDVRQLVTRRANRLVAHGGATPAAVVPSP